MIITANHDAIVGCILNVMDRSGGGGSYLDMADEILRAGFIRPDTAEQPTQAPVDRVAEMMARAYGTTLAHDPRFAPFDGLPRRIAWLCLRNKVENARAAYDAVCTGAVRSWHNCGPVAIRALCTWLATKFPTDPPPCAPVDQPTTNGH